jgi:hypothetical protein
VACTEELDGFIHQVDRDCDLAMDGFPFIHMQKRDWEIFFNRLRRWHALVLKATSVRELHSLHASIIDMMALPYFSTVYHTFLLSS